MISYYYHFGGRDGLGSPEISMYDAVYVLPIGTVTLAIMNPAGAFLYRYVDPKILIAVGGTFGVTAMLLATQVSTFAQFIVCFSVIYGTGVGLSYFAPLASGWEWMPERKGFVTGMVLAAFGFGAFFFSFISTAIVNPENARPEKLPDGRLIYSPEVAERVSRLLSGLIFQLCRYLHFCAVWRLVLVDLPSSQCCW